MCECVRTCVGGWGYIRHVYPFTAYAEELPAAARIRLVIVSADKDKRKKPVTMCANHQKLNNGKQILHNRGVTSEGCQGLTHTHSLCTVVTIPCMYSAGQGVRKMC